MLQLGLKEDRKYLNRRLLELLDLALEHDTAYIVSMIRAFS